MWSNRVWIYLILICFSFAPVTVFGKSIKLSKHNLSVSGTGKIKSNLETRICIFCHISHTSRSMLEVSTPLWNRKDSNANYTTYSSSTINYTPLQPTGSTRMCLSCHDGTIALGDTFRKPLKDMKYKFIQNVDDGYVGVDLSDEHPVSLPYTETQKRNKKLKASSHFKKVKLENDQLQCVSCHDVHDDTNGDFLIESDRESLLCIECHDEPGWQNSIHKISSKKVKGNGKNAGPKTKYNTVQENGCSNCHSVHKAPGRTRLMKHKDIDETCLSCHDGNIASDIKRLFNPSVKRYSHTNPQKNSESHDPLENYENTVTKHVKCVDCHNAHQVTSDKTHLPPNANGVTKSVKGIDQRGNSVSTANYLYEICYKCHGSLHNNVAPTSSKHITRESDSWNTLQEFSPSNPSYHPVEGGKKNSSPSLKTDIIAQSGKIYCHDCHNNDDTETNKLSGPHGSNFEWILEKEYVVTDPNQYSSQDYALCYKCHSESSILDNVSFPLHYKHIVEESTPCSVCHDPHGVERKLSGDSTHLINFDLDSVTPSGGQLYFNDMGSFRGSCVLRCHNKDHNVGPDGQPEFTYPSNDFIH